MENEKYPNKQNKYGVCEDCSKVNLQEVCKGCGREPSKGKCKGCNKHIGGGFQFEEGHLKGLKCFDCLMISHDKEKGWQALDQISETLREIPTLNGRHWKEYASKLKEQRIAIAHIVSIYQAQKPEYIK